MCYYCDDKYNPNHKCKPTYLLLIEEEEIAEILLGISKGLSDVPEEEEESLTSTPEISLNAMAGQYHPSTLRMQGQCLIEPLMILLDSGSTHNFMRTKTAERLKLFMTSTKPFKVHVGSGDSLICKAKCDNVLIQIQGHEFPVDFFVLDFNGLDVVLGVQWLQTLGTVHTNYRDLTMEFD